MVDVGQMRAELERILASPEFASSRHLQDFLRYASEKAFAGADHLDQVEIAASVLGKGEDFNPVEDASVRKLASLTRQRLEQYYARAGLESAIRVSLPVRSYLPKFEEVTPEQVPPSPWPRRMALACVAAIAVGASLGWWAGWRREWNAPLTFHIRTASGDLIGQGSDVVPGGVRLGPELGPFDGVIARLRFAPQREAHQAGILIWSGPDHYVKLGRRFFARNQIEFSHEEPPNPSGVPHPGVFDPDGQNGQPVWLSIRRQGDTYYGLVSRDGQIWEPAGPPITPKKPLEKARAAIYAYHGRREAPSIQAEFTHLSTGLVMDQLDGAVWESLADLGWTWHVSCGDSLQMAPVRPVLQVGLAPGVGNCQFELVSALRSERWAVETKLDFFPAPGVSAGIGVRGDKGAVRLVRYFLNGPAIALIHDGRNLVGVSDLNGSPAVVLRLSARGGVLRGAYSADGERFHELPLQVRLSELGGNLRAGLRTGATSLAPADRFPPARFYYFRRDITELQNYR